MITKITTADELKQIFTEILLNKTDKISDISNESVLNGMAYGCAKMAQRLLINQAVVEGHLFPDTAYGTYLDDIALSNGIAPRFKSYGSTTYVRVEAAPGTTYTQGAIRFNSTAGITFVPEEDYTVDQNGYGYIKVQSVQTGETTNVDALTINSISNPPDGHIACTNEYKATGGMDEESDELFRQRIKESVNQLARGTISFIEQIFMKINKKVLRVHKGGIDGDGKLCLTVVSVNGQNFTQSEFNEMMSQSEEFLNLSEILRPTSGYALKLQNPNWLPIDVDFRVDIDESYDIDLVRRNIQIAIAKLFDYRYWDIGERVEWENILYVVQKADGVRYVPDAYFYPQADIIVDKYRLPRVKGFVMRDINGNVISDNYGVLADFYYPNEEDLNFQTSVVSSI